MDISAWTRLETAAVIINDPFGNPTDVVVNVYPTNSNAFREAVKAYPSSEDETSEQTKDRGARLLQSVIASWKNVEWDGKVIKPDSAAALEMLKDDRADWFSSQIMKAAFNPHLFFLQKND